MTLDLSLAALVRAGSGLLLAVVALALAALAPRTLRIVGLSLALAGAGLRVVVSNITGAGLVAGPVDPSLAPAAFTALTFFDGLSLVGSVLVIGSVRDRVARVGGLVVALVPPVATLLAGPASTYLGAPEPIQALRNAPFVGLVTAATGAAAALSPRPPSPSIPRISSATSFAAGAGGAPPRAGASASTPLRSSPCSRSGFSCPRAMVGRGATSSWPRRSRPSLAASTSSSKDQASP